MFFIFTFTFSLLIKKFLYEMKLFPLLLKVFLFLLFVFDNGFFKVIDLGLFIFIL